jgi:hypothetical protein
VNLRRSLALGAAGLAATAALGACGFNYPSDRPYQVNEVGNDRDGTVEVLNAAIVARQPNSGTFVATFVNGSYQKPITMQSASGDNTAISSVDAPTFTLKPGGLRSLAATKGFPVSGTFALGQFVTMTFQFDNGQTSSLSVPVVADDGQWAGLDIATPSASPQSSGPASPSSPTSGATPTESGGSSPTPTDAAS